MNRLDDSTGKHHRRLEHLLHVYAIHSVLAILGQIARIPVEAVGDVVEPTQPRCGLGVLDQSHSYSIAIAGARARLLRDEYSHRRVGAEEEERPAALNPRRSTKYTISAM